MPASVCMCIHYFSLGDINDQKICLTETDVAYCTSWVRDILNGAVRLHCVSLEVFMVCSASATSEFRDLPSSLPCSWSVEILHCSFIPGFLLSEPWYAPWIEWHSNCYTLFNTLSQAAGIYVWTISSCKNFPVLFQLYIRSSEQDFWSFLTFLSVWVIFVEFWIIYEVLADSWKIQETPTFGPVKDNEK